MIPIIMLAANFKLTRLANPFYPTEHNPCNTKLYLYPTTAAPPQAL